MDADDLLFAAPIVRIVMLEFVPRRMDWSEVPAPEGPILKLTWVKP